MLSKDFLQFASAHRAPANLQQPRPWYSFRNLAPGEAEIYIYDIIGESWFGGITAQQFVQDLNAISATKVVLRVNSPGGDIADGIAIRNALIRHPANVESHIDGLAASTASWVALAGDSLFISPSAMLMIHEPFNIILGDAEEMRKQADILDLFGSDIAAMYAAKAGGTIDEWRDRMKAETWYTDQQAVDAGLADSIGETAPAPSNRYDSALLSIFKNTPEHLLRPPAPPARAADQVDLTPHLLAYQRNRSRLLGVR